MFGYGERLLGWMHGAEARTNRKVQEPPPKRGT